MFGYVWWVFCHIARAEYRTIDLEQCRHRLSSVQYAMGSPKFVSVCVCVSFSSPWAIYCWLVVGYPYSLFKGGASARSPNGRLPLEVCRKSHMKYDLLTWQWKITMKSHMQATFVVLAQKLLCPRLGEPATADILGTSCATRELQPLRSIIFLLHCDPMKRANKNSKVYLCWFTAKKVYLCWFILHFTVVWWCFCRRAEYISWVYRSFGIHAAISLLCSP